MDVTELWRNLETAELLNFQLNFQNLETLNWQVCHICQNVNFSDVVLCMKNLIVPKLLNLSH